MFVYTLPFSGNSFTSLPPKGSIVTIISESKFAIHFLCPLFWVQAMHLHKLLNISTEIFYCLFILNTFKPEIIVFPWSQQGSKLGSHFVYFSTKCQQFFIHSICHICSSHCSHCCPYCGLSGLVEWAFCFQFLPLNPFCTIRPLFILKLPYSETPSTWSAHNRYSN